MWSPQGLDTCSQGPEEVSEPSVSAASHAPHLEIPRSPIQPSACAGSHHQASGGKGRVWVPSEMRLQESLCQLTAPQVLAPRPRAGRAPSKGSGVLTPVVPWRRGWGHPEWGPAPQGTWHSRASSSFTDTNRMHWDLRCP